MSIFVINAIAPTTRTTAGISTRLFVYLIGRELIRFGLQQMKISSVEAIVTFGDPDYYSKNGFLKITQGATEAPYLLTFPDGWQAQSLTSSAISPKQAKVQCVESF